MPFHSVDIATEVICLGCDVLGIMPRTYCILQTFLIPYFLTCDVMKVFEALFYFMLAILSAMSNHLRIRNANHIHFLLP